jgi:TfoX/Sxy family transcriptional regulator of competence genes
MAHGGDVTTEALFGAVAGRLVSEDALLEQGRMLRSVGLKTTGKFFATAVDDELVLKLPAERVSELVASGAGRPFESGGRVMKEWVRLRPSDEAACLAYVLEARRFVEARSNA